MTLVFAPVTPEKSSCGNVTVDLDTCGVRTSFWEIKGNEPVHLFLDRTRQQLTDVIKVVFSIQKDHYYE